MAPYDQLPVYRVSYDFLLETFAFVSKLPREFKYTLGEHIKEELLLLIRSIYRANGSIERRKTHITDAREHLETIRLFLRLIKDMHHISTEKFIRLNELVEQISKQLVLWERSLIK
jgi:hypothetical protein